MCKKTEGFLPTGAVQFMFPEFDTMSEREKTSLRKTAYYRRRLNPEVFSIEELRRLPVAQVWELCRVDLSTIHRWRSGKVLMPYATQQLLRYCLYGVVPHGLCGNWGGAQFRRDGRLYPADCAYGYSSGELKGFYLVQNTAGEVPGLKIAIERLSRELDFHKQQTKENSRLGFMRGLVEALEEIA